MPRIFNQNVSDDIDNPTVGSAWYFWHIKMAIDPNLIDNPLNEKNVEWWAKERARIESIKCSFKPKLVVNKQGE